jgi:hypothetical protein
LGLRGGSRRVGRGRPQQNLQEQSQFRISCLDLRELREGQRVGWAGWHCQAEAPGPLWPATRSPALPEKVREFDRPGGLSYSACGDGRGFRARRAASARQRRCGAAAARKPSAGRGRRLPEDRPRACAPTCDDPPHVRLWSDPRSGVSVCAGSALKLYFPTRCPTSFSFSSQTYSISSVSGCRLKTRWTVQGLL